MAQEKGWRAGAEIGVLRGVVLLALLRACPNLTMIGIDTWDYWPGPETPNPDTGEARHSHLPMKQYEAEVMRAIVPFGDRARIIKKLSVEAAKDVADASLDFVFIDAAHTTEAVLQDIAAWAPKVKLGGYLTGHDIHWPAVRRAIDRSFMVWEELAANHMWVAKRDALVSDTAGKAA
jgi:predicted O-methyltransferase YrrM